MIVGIYIASTIVGLLILGNFFTYIIQDWFILRPLTLRKKHVFDFNIPFEEFMLESPENGMLNVLWFKREDEKRPCVVYYHGNSSNLDSWGIVSEYFDELGFDLIIYDYRGFGKSKGHRTERTFYSDALFIYSFANDHYSTENIVIYGRSLGCSMASYVAKYEPAKCCILETPFHSMPSLFKTYYPFLPAFLFKFKYNLNTFENVGHSRSPLYIFHGTKDRLTPYRCAIQMIPFMKEPENFYTILGGKHNDLAEYMIYHQAMEKILK